MLIALFGLSLNISISATLILAALLLIEWGVRAARKPEARVWRSSPLDIPIAIYFLWSIFTAGYCGSTSVGEAISRQSALVLFYWAAQRLDESSLRRLFYWFCAGAIFSGVLGIIQRFDGVNFLPTEQIYQASGPLASWPKGILRYLALRNDRAVGTRSHPLTYAECFIPAFFLLSAAVVAALRRKSLRSFVGSAAALAAVVGGILFATGRAVWLGIAIGFLFFAWFSGRRFFAKIFVAGALFAGGLLLLGPASMRGRLLSIVSSHSGSAGDQASKETRFTIWQQSLNQIKARPLVGAGFDGARFTSIDPISGQERVWSEAHNMYLQQGVELGFVGLGFFIWILVVAARMMGGLPASWKAAFIGMFVTFLVAGLTESWTHDKEVAMVFWLFLGCAAVLRRCEKV